jgi:hypothetical protein
MLLATVLLAGCAGNPIQQGADSFKKALTTEAEATSVALPALTLKVPADSGIQQRPVANYSTVIVRDVGYDSRSATVMANAMYNRLLNEQLTPNSFAVHARTDNGMAGSGVRYAIGFDVTESSAGYSVVFKPTTRSTYQEGLIGKFPVPNFSETDLRSYLTSLQLVYRFEVDSPYNTESVTANFMRRAKPRTDRQGWADPVTGKIYSTYFISRLRGKDLLYTVQVFPYRNGSKAVINAIVPGVETSANTVDFGVLIKDARTMLEDIVKS